MAQWVEGLDYAWIHVPIPAMRQYGAKFVCRYLSNDSNKNLSIREAKDLSDANIWMVVVRETTANRATAGYDAGAIDARQALMQARTIGMPKDRPIYFAVDFDAAGPEVLEYFKGIASQMPVSQIGIYGGLRSVRYLHSKGRVKWVWQTYAWSGGLWHSTTHIRQYKNDIKVGGIDCDADRALLPDYGQWMPGKYPTDPQEQKEVEVQFGQLKNGLGAMDMIVVPQGISTNIAFGADNGFQGLPATKLRVAIRDAVGWHTSHIVVDGNPKDKNGKSNPIQYVIRFPDPKTTGVISVIREDDGAVNVAWEIS